MQGKSVVFETPGSWGVYARRELKGVVLDEYTDRFGEQWVLVQSEQLKTPRWLHHTFVKATPTTETTATA